jgi:hypothetical protein
MVSSGTQANEEADLAVDRTHPSQLETLCIPTVSDGKSIERPRRFGNERPFPRSLETLCISRVSGDREIDVDNSPMQPLATLWNRTVSVGGYRMTTADSGANRRARCRAAPRAGARAHAAAPHASALTVGIHSTSTGSGERISTSRQAVE